jgi:hypothetical protein
MKFAICALATLVVAAQVRPIEKRGACVRGGVARAFNQRFEGIAEILFVDGKCINRFLQREGLTVDTRGVGHKMHGRSEGAGGDQHRQRDAHRVAVVAGVFFQWPRADQPDQKAGRQAAQVCGIVNAGGGKAVGTKAMGAAILARL